MSDNAENSTTADSHSTQLPPPSAQPDEPQYHRKFGTRTTADEVLSGVDLAGKTVLITGATSGIGEETARVLALHGAHVVMANRNIVQSEQLREKIYQETDKRNIDLLTMDLSSLQSVKAAAKEFIAKGWPLNVLILNAGVYAPTQKTTIDGHETTFGVNHLGHFYLTHLLLEKLRESAPSRLVVVSSDFHKKTGINPTASVEEQLAKLVPAANTNEFTYKLYAYSKLCNVLMAFKIHNDEFEKSRIHTYALHPGSFIGTNISRSYGVFGKIFTTLTKPIVKTVPQGAATTAYCAASPDCEAESGKFYESCWDAETSLAKPLAQNRQLQDALWDKSLALVKEFEAKN